MNDVIVDEVEVIRCEPKPDMEYVYRLDMVWKEGVFGHLDIKKGTIMIDVIKTPKDRYEFTNKETGERLNCYYAWALAENTPENVKHIEVYNAEDKLLMEHVLKVDALRNKITTLEIEK